MEPWVSEHIVPINGQWPRPWMDADFPVQEAQVFVAGCNPAKTFPSAEIQQGEYHDALLRRNGQSVREIYRVHCQASPTRGIIDRFCDSLRQRQDMKILQTNVICYSTRRSEDMRAPEHQNGRATGGRIFSALLRRVQPQVLIVHGRAAYQHLAYTDLSTHNIRPSLRSDGFQPEFLGLRDFYGAGKPLSVFTMGPLAMPGFNQWGARYEPIVEEIAAYVMGSLKPQE